MRNPFSRKPPPVTAAATIASTQRGLDRPSPQVRAVNEAWQVWRQVGEIHYAVLQQSRLVSRVQWDILIDGEKQEQEESEEVIRQAFGRGFRELVREQTTHIQVAGGYHLVRTSPQQWQVLAMPLDYRGNSIVDNQADIVIDNRQPDPKNPDFTDSPVLAALDVAREVILARAQARAAARSRTAQLNTILYPLEGAGPDPKEFEKQLTEVMTAPLHDEMSQSSVVPNLIGFAGDRIDQWRFEDFSGVDDEGLHERIQALVKQIAIILDIPPQILMGMTELNHWAAWAVQEDNWFGHVEPLASTVGDGIAMALAAATGLEPERIEVVPDPTPLLKRRPSLSDILTAHEQGVVGGQFVRTQLGADDEDAPQPGEEPLPSREPDESASEEPNPIPAAAVNVSQIARHSLEDLVTDVTERALERIGAKVRSVSQGKDIGVQGSGLMSNADLAVAYNGEDVDVEGTVTSVVEDFLPRLGRVETRAGVDLGSLKKTYREYMTSHVHAVYHGDEPGPTVDTLLNATGLAEGRMTT